MELTVKQLAHLVNGHIEGDAQKVITGLSNIENGKEGSVTFLANPKYENYLYSTEASAVLVTKDFTPRQGNTPTLIHVDDPYLSFSSLLEEYDRWDGIRKSGTESPSHIGEGSVTGDNVYRGAFSYIGDNCKIGNNVKIFPQAYIGDNTVIGDNSIIYSGVRIYPDTQIGKFCTLHAGAVIGSDGFGFAPKSDGTYKSIPQLGNVVIEDHVDIGANTVIDCATLNSTRIRTGAKLDNLIQIAHNVDIGESTVIAAQSGISGSSTIGKYCMIGGQVGIVGHLEIADKTTIAAQAGISKNLKESGKTYLGSPALEHGSFLKSYTVFKNLPELKKRVEELEQKIINLQATT